MHPRGKGPRAADEHDGAKWSDPTLGSAGMFAFLCWTVRNRAMKNATKVQALNLILGLAKAAMEYALVATDPLVCMMMLLSMDDSLVSAEVRVTQQGMCPQSWMALLQQNPGGLALWAKLSSRCWLNRCIISRLDSPTFLDILFFLVYQWCHPTLSLAKQKVWKTIGQHCLPVVVNQMSQWLTQLAQNLAQQSLLQTMQRLPELKSKEGRARKLADPINRLLLLWKLKKEKIHRKRVGSTHDDYGQQGQTMLRYENYLDCLLYTQLLEKEFGNQQSLQISITWDPSCYGGKDAFIGVIYDPKKNLAAYLPSQQLSQILMNDLSESLLPLARSQKLTRLEGFKELKGLCSSMKAVGLKIEDFMVPTGILCKPLAQHEYRLKGPDGKVYIVNEETNTLQLQVPDAIDLGSLPVLCSISDQGPNNTAALNFCMFSSEALLFWSEWDPFHRAWNDIKNSLKKSRCKGWRTVLELTLVANINYGPFGSSAWFYKKRAKLEHFLLTAGVHSPVWLQYKHLVAMERRQPEATTPEEEQRLLESLATMESFLNKGPLIKLMRWFSFFESMLYHGGDLWATKMVFLHEKLEEDPASADEVDIRPEKDDQKELRELKKRKGTWKLAPTLINEKNITVKDCILAVAKVTWKHFAGRARELTFSDHILEYNVSCSSRNYWKAELSEMVEQSLFVSDNLDHLKPKWSFHADALEWHIDIFEKLLEARSMSLSSTHCMPPAMYHHLLSPSPADVRNAHNLALKHYKCLLDAEEAVAGGAEVEALGLCFWRLNPFIRCLFLAYEQDEAQHLVGTAVSKARRLQRVVSKNLGDSRLVENAHQHGKDLFRSSKASAFSNPTIFANCLRSGALEERKTPCLKLEAAQKAVATPFQRAGKVGINSMLRSQGHKLPKELQKMMVPKGKTNTWPSPAPATLFASAAATTWLFAYFSSNPGDAIKEQGVNAAWLSLLAKPGAFVAQQSSSRIFKVIASAEFGFLGLDVVVQQGVSGNRCFVCRKSRDAIQWHHVINLDDWLMLQFAPCFVNAAGPLGWQQVGAPLPLENACCLQGVSLTYIQIKKLIKAFGGSIKGTPSKKSSQLQLIEMILPPEQQAEAKALIEDEKGAGKEDFDSDFSELISELGQDEGNTHDLKEYKEKKKVRKLQRKMAAAGDEVVTLKQRPREKARGKARGKGRGRKARKDLEACGLHLLKGQRA